MKYQKEVNKVNTLIVAGGDIDIKNLEEYCKKCREQNIIAVDKGLEALYQLDIIPNYVVGDFDSVSTKILEFYQNKPQVTFHKYNPEKDNTDTDIALKLAIQLNSSSITIMGALGKRMDHALSNIHILKEALAENIHCQILDTNNKIYLVNNNVTLYRDRIYGKYISLIPLTTTVEGLTLKGFQYPLNNASLSIGKSLGVSNEMTQDIATIKLKRGILIVIESKD